MRCVRLATALLCAITFSTAISWAETNAPIMHDAEHYLLLKQHRDAWAMEDQQIAQKLAVIRAKNGGKRPNIVHIMWDDSSLGEVGMPAFNQIRGYDTPHLNKMAKDGILFTRMYTEPSCTPTRSACLTGRLSKRTAMFKVEFPIEGSGLHKDEVTLAEVLSKAGYSTAFYGKGHQGDIEESHLHNQGFDEASFSMYNQFPPMFWHKDGETLGLTWGYTKNMWDKKYALDKLFRPSGYIMNIEGKKGELARETSTPTIENYQKLNVQHQQLALDYIRRKAASDKPFYLAYWPNVYDFVGPTKEPFTTNASTAYAQNQERLDRYIGEVVAELEKQGVAENTLIVAMSDNGPMHEMGPNGMYENIFSGGKGSYKEGGIRVTAFAQWPGVIEPGQTIGDMITCHDLFTTFARLGEATQNIPTDRIIDGIDQTALLLSGDTHGRRDYYFVYTGPILAASIKQQYKRVWVGDRPGLVGNAFYDLYRDHKEKYPQMAQFLWAWSPFDKMRGRHEELMEKFPNRPVTHGTPFSGISNLRPESKEAQKLFRPFDRLWDGRDMAP